MMTGTCLTRNGRYVIGIGVFVERSLRRCDGDGSRDDRGDGLGHPPLPPRSWSPVSRDDAIHRLSCVRP